MFKNFFKKDLYDKNDYLRFLRKTPLKEFVYLKKEDKLQKLTAQDFFKLFEVEYLTKLYFDDVKILNKIVSKYKKLLKKEVLAEKEIWQGVYHQKDLESPSVPPVYIKWINDTKGYGVFALKDLKKGAYIGEYTGKVKKYGYNLDKKNAYCFEYATGQERKTKFTIDAKYMGNHTRFINHSGDCNLVPSAAYCDGIIHIILKTGKFIPKDTELLYNYGFKYWKKREKPL